uniref:H-2 class II histocompatibility antigen gamma chain-like n=1 Tax=Salmo trutta TaxID=8032 RepID=A0A673X764_SALTR
MEEQQQHDDALLERTGSQDVILPMTATRGASNSRPLKIAGFTVLACLLLAGQAFTAYMVFNQRGQIHDMEKSNDNMRKQLRNRPPAVAPVQMHMPMLNMPRLIDFTDEDEKTPMTKLEATAIVSLEKQVKDLLQNPQLPQFNETFLANLQSLKRQMEEAEWKGFEAWTRNWLLFQMFTTNPRHHHHPPTFTPPYESAGLQTKCNLEASKGRKLGAYLPQCDEQGNYLPMQCWHATGFCWCVDKDGKPIEGTSIRGRATCDRVPSRMAAFPRRMQLKEYKGECFTAKQK